MFGIKALAVGATAAVLFATAAPAAQAIGLSYAPDTATAAASTDWSGWDVTGGTYTSVSASWTVPTVTCTTGETSYSADWVGLDGDGSDSVEQIGTSSDCDPGTPSYTAWYEFYPEASVQLTNPVKAGDNISASVVSVAGTDEFKLVLTDTTQGWTKTETGESPSGTGASAEIIAEAPSGSSRQNSVLPLADFKAVTFTDVLVDGKAIGANSAAAKIAMVDSSGSPMATTSALTANNKFTVTWVSSGDTASTSGLGSNGFGDGANGFGGGGNGFGDGGSDFGGGASGQTGGFGYSDGSSDGYGAGGGIGEGYGVTADGSSVWSS